MTLKEKYFKNGNLLVTRNGNIYMVMNYAHSFENENNTCKNILVRMCTPTGGYMTQSRYDDNMRCPNSPYDVMQVRKYKGFGFFGASESNNIIAFSECIWKRREE